MRSAAPTNPSDAAAGLALGRRIVTAPRLCAPELARARLDSWLAGLGETPAAYGLRRLRGANPVLDVLLQSIAEASPYLWELASSAPDRLLALLQSDPDQRLPALRQATAAAVAAALNDAEAMSCLRRMKGEAALLIAVADTAIGAALHYLLLDARRRGRIRAVAADGLEQASGYFVLAMGKMGAFELNYSSDIDIIALFDPRAAVLPPDSEPAPFYVGLTRRLVKLLQERTAEGYVFRVDL